MGSRIAVVGTGANGSCISADLIGAGYEVTMIDQWPAHIETMRRDGLRITLGDEVIHVRPDAHHICELCTLNRRFDTAFICVKAYDTRWAGELIRPYLAEDGLCVGIQNAMTADDIAEIVGPDRTIGCVVELASEMFTPGQVKRSIPHARTWFGIGALEASMEPRVGEVEEILLNVGRVTRSEDIRSAKWMKLIVNAMGMCPQAMVGLNGTRAVELPGMRALMLRCGEEALAAGQAAGHRIEPVMGLAREEVEGSNRLLDMLLDKIIADVGPTANDTVIQDHMKGRLSEVDLISGGVVEAAARHGLAAPANAAIAEVTRRIHEEGLAPDPSNLELAYRLLES